MTAETDVERGIDFWRGLLEAAPDAMVVVDRDRRIVLVNVQTEQQFGYRRDELLGRDIKSIIPEGLIEGTLHHEAGAVIELTGRRKDGSEFPAEITLSSFESAGHAVMTAAIRNTSVRKHMERLKDEFVATVSHELRTPLTSISGSLGLLAGQWSTAMPDSAARLLAIAHKNTQRLVRLVNDILDIEKIDSGHVPFSLGRVSVHQLVEQVIEGNRGFAETYGVHVNLDAALAESDVNADPDRLAQVVTNLLSNAIKFSPQDGEVLVKVEKKRNFVVISVRDFGRGIPDDFKPHIFQKFAQADVSDARQKSGTGLGLSIVKRIIDRLSGEVGFDDAPGAGTIFHVKLPVWGSVGPRILHLDDDHNVLAAVSEALRIVADIVSVDSIEVARAALKANRIDLAVLDITLRGESGLDLLSDLRDANGQPIPVIVFAQNAANVSGGQIGCAISKSDAIDDLVQAVRDRLGVSTVARPGAAA